MKYFIFRNNTIEPFFFGSDYVFSGYGDISQIPEEAETYVWFYQVPINTDNKATADEINSYAESLQMIVSKIPATKPLIAVTMVDLTTVPLTSNDFCVTQSVNVFNDSAIRIANERNNVKIVDFQSFTNNFIRSELIDWKYYFISQMGINPKLAPAFRKWWKRQMDILELKRKKCLVLDLDNTLWGGVLGEDGIDGIKIGGDYPGKAYSHFQKALNNLAKSGVILTVCSKNNETDVIDAWAKNPFMTLKKDNFATYRINWQDKATNITGIAHELNIGLDSMVFIDDNPTERELVRQMLPMVEVPEFPSQPYMLPAYFSSLVEKYFRVYAITKEDIEKTAQYKANAARETERQKFSDYGDYLKSLGINIKIMPVDNFNIQRIAQMTQKTNQFNLTTKRYSDIEIKQMSEHGMRIWCISVSDRFGDNGITGAIFVNAKVEIDNLLLSCRILGKGIENAFIKSILNLLKQDGFIEVRSSYIPTAKNQQVANFYENCGFTMTSENDNGSKNYYLNLEATDFAIEDYYHIDIL